MTLTIILPQKVSQNATYAGMHWAARKRLADEYHEAVWVAVKERGKPKGLLFPARMAYTFFLPGKQMDVSNLGLMIKLLEDGLVQEGVLPDDGPEYVQAITMSFGRPPTGKKIKVAYAEVEFV